MTCLPLPTKAEASYDRKLIARAQAVCGAQEEAAQLQEDEQGREEEAPSPVSMPAAGSAAL